MKSGMHSKPARPRMVVIGAGFGGSCAVQALAKLPIDVVLINRNNDHLFQLLLYQVAAAELSGVDIAVPIRSILASYPNAKLLLGEVDGIDTKARFVSVGAIGALAYHQLIIAYGALLSWCGNDQ